MSYGFDKRAKTPRPRRQSKCTPYRSQSFQGHLLATYTSPHVGYVIFFCTIPVSLLFAWSFRVRGSTWIAARQGNDHLSLPTYAEDFHGAKPTALFIGVHGRPEGKFSIETTITDVGEREIGAYMPLGSLRGSRKAPAALPVPVLDDQKTHRQTHHVPPP